MLLVPGCSNFCLMSLNLAEISVIVLIRSRFIRTIWNIPGIFCLSFKNNTPPFSTMFCAGNNSRKSRVREKGNHGIYSLSLATKLSQAASYQVVSNKCLFPPKGVRFCQEVHTYVQSTVSPCPFRPGVWKPPDFFKFQAVVPSLPVFPKPCPHLCLLSLY